MLNLPLAMSLCARHVYTHYTPPLGTPPPVPTRVPPVHQLAMLVYGWAQCKTAKLALAACTAKAGSESVN